MRNLSYSFNSRTRCKHCGKKPDVTRCVRRKYLLPYSKEVAGRNLRKSAVYSRHALDSRYTLDGRVDDFARALKFALRDISPRYHKNLRNEGSKLPWQSEETRGYEYTSMEILTCSCGMTQWALRCDSDDNEEKVNRLSIYEIKQEY